MPAGAEPIVPLRDDEVIEVLPAASADRDEARRLRRQLVARPDDLALALQVARRGLERARGEGDPRFAGHALAALRPWPDAATAPADVVILRATLQQHLHQFDEAVQGLRRLLARPGGAPLPQAWLTVATVLRVQGRLAESDLACRAIGDAGAALHASACLAENAALRGDSAARSRFEALLAQPGLPVPTQVWLLTSLAELEEREGRGAAAEAAFLRIRRLGADPYALLAHADFLLAERRPGEALALLRGAPRSDPVLLRMAIAGARSGAPEAARDAAEMRSRIALANERPGARLLHGREQAMFALQVENLPAEALALARDNLSQQREPIDLLLLAQAARAAGAPGAIEEARRIKAALGLHDRRLDALL